MTQYQDSSGKYFGTHAEAAASNTAMGTNPTITSDALNPLKPVKLPTATPETGATGLEASITSSTGAIKSESDRLYAERVAAQDAKKTDLTAAMNKIAGINTDIANAPNTIDRSAQDAAKKSVDTYTSQIEAEQLSNRRRIEKLQKTNPNGLFGGGLEQEVNRINRDSVSHQADLAILLNSANRQYDTAASIADRQLQMKLEPLKANLENLKFFYTENKADFNKEDDRLYSELIKKQEKELKKQEDIENSIKQMKLNAANYAGSAAPSVLAALSAIDTKDPQAFDKAVKIAGKYATDPLDRALKTAQINKINAEIAQVGQPSAKEKKEAVEALKSKEGQNLALQDKIDKVDVLLKHSGLNSRVGANIASRKATTFGGRVGRGIAGAGVGAVAGLPFAGVGAIPGALGGFAAGFAGPGLVDDLTGKGQDFAGQVHQLVSKEFLDALINAKAAGATFGSLTDREGDALRASATAINDWEIKDDKGLGTGVWNIDEASFMRELTNIQTLSKRSMYSNQGSTLDTSETATLDELWNPNNMALDPSKYYQTNPQ